MTPSEISTAIGDLVALVPDSVFLRATDKDANVDTDHIDLGGKTLCLYNNLPDVASVVTGSGAILESWPIEIRIMRLADFDDNTVQGDLLRDVCSRAADIIFTNIPTVFPLLLDSPMEYNKALLGEVKVYDKTLTGCRLAFVLQMPIDKYCTAP